MPVPTAKELKKLAKACREAGIHYFKSADFEFTLTGVAPEKPSKNKFASSDVQGEIESDTLTEEELLYWSSNGGMPVEIET